MRAEIEALAEAIEEGSESGGEAGWWTRTSIGGYGEVHWSNSATPVDETVTSTTSPAHEVDIHRYVLFIGHEFNKYLNFASEVEIEHAFVQEGEGDLN